MVEGPQWRIVIGDVRFELADLEAGSVQCCVTSPPYWGLRDYGTGTWDGGTGDCDHLGDPFRTKAAINANCGTGVDRKNAAQRQPMGQVCAKCGARRTDSQIGLEATPELYVEALVGVFREVKRVLADDGVLWLNLGDSYVSIGGSHDDRTDNQPNVGAARIWRDGAGRADGVVDERGQRNRNGVTVPGMKPKNLVGIPWRVALALQVDGWTLRSDVIWAKPNPMPESVTDRPTKAHEYIFLLTKNERYYFNAAAVREPGVEPDRQRADRIGGANGHAVRHSPGGMAGASQTRNIRTVWTIPLQPYAEAHFATFPEAIPERCIAASSREGDMVLDPFTGSGTTGQVAIRLGRSFTGIELNPEYAALARRRIASATPLFAQENMNPAVVPKQGSLLDPEETR